MKVFVLISSSTPRKTNLHFVQKKAIYNQIMVVVQKVNVTVIADMLFFTKIQSFLICGIRTHQGEHFSYHMLKSLYKQQNGSYSKISWNLILKNPCQLF